MHKIFLRPKLGSELTPILNVFISGFINLFGSSSVFMNSVGFEIGSGSVVRTRNDLEPNKFIKTEPEPNSNPSEFIKTRAVPELSSSSGSGQNWQKVPVPAGTSAGILYINIYLFDYINFLNLIKYININ